MSVENDSDSSQEKPTFSETARGLKYLFDSGLSIEYLCETGLIDVDLERVDVMPPDVIGWHAR